MTTPIDEQIVQVLHWAHTNPAQELRLLTAVQVWLNDNDDDKSTAEVLAERFQKENDPDMIAQGDGVPKIYEVRTILSDKGLHVTFWRSDGSDYTIFTGYSRFPNRVISHIRRAAAIQEAVAKYQAQSVMVAWEDLDGLPRAWATGPRAILDDIREYASGELDNYIADKLQKGHSLPCEPDDFREVITEWVGE